MLRSLAIATAIAFGSVIAAPVFAQDAAQGAAAQQTPVQVVQAVSDDLAKAIDGHQQELKNNREKLTDVIDVIESKDHLLDDAGASSCHWDLLKPGLIPPAKRPPVLGKP